jgi:Phage major capsid protein E
MSYNVANLWADDGFSAASLTAAINDIDHIPSRAGAVVFDDPDVFKGVNTISVAIEREQESIKLIRTSPRGGPVEKEGATKRSLIKFDIPQIKLEDTIYADQVQDARKFGTLDPLTPEEALSSRMQKMASRLDYTTEFHRLGALRGLILDADGSLLTDLFQAFSFENSLGLPGPETFDFDLGNLTADAEDIRIRCHDVHRFMVRNLKTTVTADARVWAFVGDEFFDALISNRSVKATYNGIEAAKARLGDNYATGVFEFGGIFFENYQGSDDNEEIAIAPDEARFFLTGIPGLYEEYYAPADFMETVNTPGLRRYAKVAPDQRFNQKAELHVQSNPLPLCLRPATLCRGIMG